MERRDWTWCQSKICLCNVTQGYFVIILGHSQFFPKNYGQNPSNAEPIELNADLISSKFGAGKIIVLFKILRLSMSGLSSNFRICFLYLHHILLSWGAMMVYDTSIQEWFVCFLRFISCGFWTLFGQHGAEEGYTEVTVITLMTRSVIYDENVSVSTRIFPSQIRPWKLLNEGKKMQKNVSN